MQKFIERDYNLKLIKFDPIFEMGNEQVNLLQFISRPQEEIDYHLDGWEKMNQEMKETQSFGHASNGIYEDTLETFKLIRDMVEFKNSREFDVLDGDDMNMLIKEANYAVFKQFVALEIFNERQLASIRKPIKDLNNGN